MLHKHLINIFLLCSIFCLNSVLAQTVVWDESVDGDLPSNSGGSLDNTLFESISLVDGVNLIKGSVANDSFNGTVSRDAFSFTVPPSASVSNIYSTVFTLQNDATVAAIAGYSGSPLARLESQFYNTTGSLAASFTGVGFPLPSGEYGMWISSFITEGLVYEISITCNGCPPPPAPEIPTLSEWGLLILALLLMTLGTLYLVQPNFRERFEQK